MSGTHASGTHSAASGIAIDSEVYTPCPFCPGDFGHARVTATCAGGPHVGAMVLVHSRPECEQFLRHSPQDFLTEALLRVAQGGPV